MKARDRPPSDGRTFARRIPVVIAAAAMAEASGALGTQLVREYLGTSTAGSTAAAENLIFVAIAIAPATVVLSVAFAGTWFAASEALLVAASTGLSFWFGPVVFGLADFALGALFGRGWTQFRTRFEPAYDAFWAIPIFVVMAIGEYYVWTATSRGRARRFYARFSRLVRGKDSDDQHLRAQVRNELSSLRRVQTAETTELVESIDAWAKAWLDHPGGLTDPRYAPLASAIEREMTRLYGPASSSHEARHRA